MKKERIVLQNIQEERQKLSQTITDALNDFKQKTGYGYPEDVRFLLNLTHKDDKDHRDVVVFFNQEKYCVSNVDPKNPDENLVNGVPGSPHEYAAVMKRKAEEEELNNIKKLPLEAQEIVEYYSRLETSDYNYLFQHYFSLINELAPFLDSKFLHVEEGKHIHGLDAHEYQLLGLSMRKYRIKDHKDALSSSERSKESIHPKSSDSDNQE